MTTLEAIGSSLPYGARVYKDDCMYNFDTAENNPNGLDVCLQCYQAFSRGVDSNYTQEHALKKEHDFYFNIRKTLKENPNKYNELGESNSKLAKLEVKDVAEEDIYDFIYTIYSNLSDDSIPLEDAPQNIQLLTQEILATNSSNRQDEIKTWEQEIQPCEHSVSIQPVQTLTTGESKPVLDQCLECSLKENLWICLHCGIIGCGRQQYGSTLQGNSHMLAHYEAHPTHPVAIKLGSLDVDNCDAYCYKCNDEVKVPELVAILLAYGIDVSTLVKTEKNLIELNLDQNLNWDFKLDGANGEKLPPVFGPGLTGFQNLGNSCYLNSVIQVLYSLPAYTLYFKEFDGKFPENVTNPAVDLTSQLLKIYDGLSSGRYSVPSHTKDDTYQLGIKPSAFKTLIGENHPEFQTQRQQDAFEFLLYFLEKSNKEVGSKLNESFKFVVENKIKCLDCENVKLSTELVDNLSIPIKDVVDSVDAETGTKTYKTVQLNDSLTDYCAPELLGDYKCPKCTSYNMLKSIGLKSFPSVLIVNAKRIKLENWVPVKIDVPIEVPGTIDISELKSKGLQEGEIEIEEDEDEQDSDVRSSKFEPNQEALNSLLSMGFPEPRSIKSLHATGNNSAEEAMNWLFAHMDDADIDSPLQESGSNKDNSKNEPSEELVNNLVGMGFSTQLATKALILNGSDVNAAVEWLFSNPDDDGVIESTSTPTVEQKLDKEIVAQLEGTGNPKYKLHAVVCHKGTSPHTGHYVAFIRKIIDGEEKWVLFNDEKVVACADLLDVITNGYVYIFVEDKL